MPSLVAKLTPDQEKRRVVGEWRLEQRPGSPNWYRVTYDAEKKTNVCFSLRESSFDAAHAKLIAHVAGNPTQKRKDPSVVLLHDALDWYWEAHGKTVTSASSNKLAINYWKEFWKASTVIEGCTPVEQKKFHEWLRKKDLSEGYISRIVRIGRAALNGYRDNLFVTWVPRIKDNQTQADKDDADPKGRPLELEELAKLCRHADEPHLQILIAIMLNTICRPSAALELTAQQVDFKLNRVQLNPTGRRQTKKYRPHLPLTKYLKTILTAVMDQQIAEAQARGEAKFKVRHFVLFKGEPIKSVKTAWRTMVVRAGFVVPVEDMEDEYQRDEITPYSLRHTMARVLRDARVYEEERNVYLGHLRKGSARTGVIYAPDDPKYLAEPAAVIDAFMVKLAGEMEKQAKAEAKLAA